MAIAVAQTSAASAHSIRALHRVAGVTLPYADLNVRDVSPDGRLVAALRGSDRAALVVDARTGSIVQTLRGPQAFAYDARFTPDGSALVVVGDGITVWSTADWSLTRAIAFGTNVAALTFGSNGRTLFASGDGVLHAVDVQTGRLLWTAASQPRNIALAASDDGALLAAGNDGGGIRLFDARTGLARGKLADPHAPGKQTAASRGGYLAHAGRVVALAFSRDRLVSAGGEGVLKTWNLERRTRTAYHTCAGSAGPLTRVPDGTLFAGCEPDIFGLAPDGRRVATLRGHARAVFRIASTRDGRTVWSQAADGTIKRWLPPRERAAATYGDIVAASFSADGRRIALMRGDDEIVVRGIDGSHRAVLTGWRDPPRGISFSHLQRALRLNADGTRLLAGSYTTVGFVDHSGIAHARLALYDASRSGTRPARTWQDVAMASAAFSEDGQRALVRSPALSDSPDTVWRIALDGGVIDRWTPVQRIPPCNLSDGFQYAVPLSVRHGDDIVFPGVACGSSSPAPARLFNIPQRRPLVAYRETMAAQAAAFDADESTVGFVARESMYFFNTQTGRLRSKAAFSAAMWPGIGREIALAVRGPYAAVLDLPMRAYPRRFPVYRATLYRTSDARVVGTVSGGGYVRLVDVFANGRIGIVTDRSIDVWAP